MKLTLCISKPVGETPLQAILRFKKIFPKYADQKISAAGRLDPMAEGLLLLLIGEENKNRKMHEDLMKEYTFQVLFGIRSDTYDLLGIPTIVYPNPLDKKTLENLELFCQKKQATYLQPYPPYSSKPIDGKPLYYWARRGMLDGKTLPSRKITITSLRYSDIATISENDLKRTVRGKIERVQGNFRQGEILSAWQTLLNGKRSYDFSVLTFQLICSSGTYVRAIADEMGRCLQTGALAFTIKRTRIGDYSMRDAISV